MEFGTNEFGTLDCHFNWQHDKKKFRQRIDRNLQTCLSHIKDNPDPTIYNFLAYLYVVKGDLVNAKYYLKACENRFPSTSITLANLATLYHQQGREKKAMSYLKKLKHIEPKLREGWICWSKAYFHIRLFEYKEALQEFDKAIKHMPKAYQLFLYRGITLNRLGHTTKKLHYYERAIISLKQAHKKQPSGEKNYIIYYHLGRAYGELSAKGKKNNGNYFRQSLENFNVALSINPDDPNALKFFGKLSCSKKQFTEALKHFDQSISARPTSSAYHNRGVLQMKKREFRNAKSDLLKALELQPSNYGAVVSLIQLLIIQKNGKEALRYCEMVPVSRQYPVVIFYWAQSLELIGEPLGAFRKYLEYVKLHRDNASLEAKAKTALTKILCDDSDGVIGLALLNTFVRWLYDNRDYESLKKVNRSKSYNESTNYMMNVYMACICIFEGNYDQCNQYLIQGFHLAKAHHEKFEVFKVYLDSASNQKFVEHVREFIALFSEFEAKFHRLESPIWHKTFSLTYGSKSRSKKLLMTDHGENVHHRLRAQYMRLAESGKQKKNQNYVHATLSLIVSDRPHEQSGEHSRRIIEIPMKIKESEVKSKKPKHVSSFYTFNVESKCHPRSELLLEDVLASKPLSTHVEIKKQFGNKKNSTFHRRFHCSERALYGYLTKPVILADIVESLKKHCNDQTNIKCYAVIIDIHSTRYLCKDCEESTFFWYNPKRNFISKFVEALLIEGFKVRTKSHTLQSVVRVSAEKPGNNQKVVPLDEHSSDPIDIKESDPNSVLLLQRDNAQAAQDSVTSVSFSNLK